MTDFARINQPRVAKIEAMIATIRKSAKSQKISAVEVSDLLSPIAAHLDGALAEAPPKAPAEPETVKPPATLRDAPHIQQIAGFVASLPREQLPSWITHVANRLCDEAEGIS